jgi:PAS domain S-box-containing protein
MNGFAARLRHPAAFWLLGCAALAAVTWLGIRLDLGFATVALAYLTVIVLLSLLDSLVPSIILWIVAAGCLDYFFVAPLFTLRVEQQQDLTALAAFVLTCAVVTGLLRRQRQGEDALRRSQAAFLAEAQQLSLTGSFGWNARTGEVSWSDQTFRIFGYDRTVAPSVEKILERVHPDDLPHVRAAFDGAAAGRELDISHRLALPDGTRKHLRVVAHPVSGAPDGGRFVGAMMDITARMETEERLRYSEHRYRNVFSAMAASFWELDFSPVTVMLRALRKSGVQDFRAYFDANPAFVREMMRNSRVIDVNDQTVRLFGRGNKEEMLTSVEPFWPEESTHVYAEAILQSIAGKPHYMTECKLRRIDGTLFDGLFTAAFPLETFGKGTLVVGVIDITERKRTFEALERGEERYRNLFQYMPMSLTQIDTSRLIPLYRQLHQQGITDLGAYLDENPDFLWQITDALVIDEVNDHNVKMFGAPSQAAMHAPITRYWTARPDTIRRAMVSLYRGDAAFQEETQVVRFDGATIDVLFSVARPAPVTDKSLVGFLDITALKRAHKAIEQSEVRYRNLFHHMPIPLWRMDSSRLRDAVQALRRDGVTDLMAYMRDHPEFVTRAMELSTVEEINQSTIQLFGAGDATALLGPVARYWSANVEAFQRILDARFRGEEKISTEVRMTTLDGRELKGLFVAAFPAQLSELGITLNAFVDATERARAEDMLQKVQAEFAHAARVSMLGELAASIAHEVNQPLAAIATSGEAGLRWLNRPEPDLDEVRDLMRRTVADARRAADIIARVRGMATRGTHTRADLSLDQIVQEALLFLGHEIQARGVTVLFDAAGTASTVRVDRTQIQQVVVNLAVNAMQAMSQSSRQRTIAIRTAALADDAVHCFVEDSGGGIAEAHLGRLFENFFTTKDNGMGMGLPICRSIVEAHGGSIRADNESAYGGARFWFSLPVGGSSPQ